VSYLVTVKVTTEDIENGMKESCFHCPVARACGRAGIVKPAVRKYAVWHGSDRTRTELPASAQQFIEDFDNGEPVVPFSFDLELP